MFRMKCSNCGGKNLYLKRTSPMETMGCRDCEKKLNEKWVAMIEGLPREHGWYLVTRECGTVEMGHWFLNEGWREGYNSKVIAWRQLPSPYPSPYRKI